MDSLSKKSKKLTIIMVVSLFISALLVGSAWYLLTVGNLPDIHIGATLLQLGCIPLGLSITIIAILSYREGEK